MHLHAPSLIFSGYSSTCLGPITNLQPQPAPPPHDRTTHKSHTCPFSELGVSDPIGWGSIASQNYVPVNLIWAASHKKVHNGLSRCHTNRRMGAQRRMGVLRAHPSFGMTPTQAIRDFFAWQRSYLFTLLLLAVVRPTPGKLLATLPSLRLLEMMSTSRPYTEKLLALSSPCNHLQLDNKQPILGLVNVKPRNAW